LNGIYLGFTPTYKSRAPLFEQALKIANALSVKRGDDLITRLDRVRVTSHRIGYGVGDDMDFLMSKFTPKHL
jgi:hypothetical protein